MCELSCYLQEIEGGSKGSFTTTFSFPDLTINPFLIFWEVSLLWYLFLDLAISLRQTDNIRTVIAIQD